MSVARVYAKALYQAAVEQKEPVAKLEPALDVILQAIDGSRELKAALYSPITSSQEKTAIVEALGKVAGLSALMTRYLALLARKVRLSALPEIREAFAEVRLSAQGGMMGELTSAEELSAADINEAFCCLFKEDGQKGRIQKFQWIRHFGRNEGYGRGVTYDGSLQSPVQSASLTD